MKIFIITDIWFWLIYNIWGW